MRRSLRETENEHSASGNPPSRDVVLREVLREKEEISEAGRHRRLGVTLAVGLAALLQVAVVIPLMATFLSGDGSQTSTTEVRTVSRRSLPRPSTPLDLERSDSPTKPPVVEEEKKDDPDADPRGQVVKLAPPDVEESPDKAEYVSEWEQKTERETRSRDQQRITENVTRKLQFGKTNVDDTPASVTAREGEKVVRGGAEGDGKAKDGDVGEGTSTGADDAPIKLAIEIPKVAVQDDVVFDEKIGGELRNRVRRIGIDAPGHEFKLSLGKDAEGLERELLAMRMNQGEGQGRRGGSGGEGLPTLAQLTPSLVELETITGAPANDHLPEVETDAETRLNAWRWKHATFFNRIADGVRRTWVGPEVLAKEDPTGAKFGRGDVWTVLSITLDRDGNVVDVMVAETSGVDVMDDEAIRSLRAAGPFPNPPEALFHGRERFTFPFGFNVGFANRNIDFDWRPY